MYCSSCGVSVAQGLSYCNQCGAKLGGARGDDAASSEVRPGNLVFAMMVVFIFGLVAITMLVGVMKTVLAFNEGAMLAFTLLSFLIMVSLEAVFLRLLFRRRRGNEGAGSGQSLKGQTTNDLNAASARALPEPVPSVTEHTTRTFDQIPRERTSK
jgi:hypothetical protein